MMKTHENYPTRANTIGFDIEEGGEVMRGARSDAWHGDTHVCVKCAGRADTCAHLALEHGPRGPHRGVDKVVQAERERRMVDDRLHLRVVTEERSCVSTRACTFGLRVKQATRKAKLKSP